MKDPNVLEAPGLCMNGNPFEDEGFSVQQFFYRLWHLDDAFYIPKGSHESFPIGEGPEPILMPSGKKHFVTDHPITFKELKEVDIKKKYGIKDEDIIMPDFFKKSIPVYMAKKKSWFKRFIDFMSSDVGRCNPYDRMSKIPEPRNPPKPTPLRTINEGKYFVTNKPTSFKELNDEYYIQKEKINAQFDREQAAIKRNQCIDDQNKVVLKKSWFSKFKKWLKYWFSPGREISSRDIVSEEAIKVSNDILHSMEDVIGKYYQQIRIRNKYLKRLRRRRRSKRYSISTPITRK